VAANLDVTLRKSALQRLPILLGQNTTRPDKERYFHEPSVHSLQGHPALIVLFPLLINVLGHVSIRRRNIVSQKCSELVADLFRRDEGFGQHTHIDLDIPSIADKLLELLNDFNEIYNDLLQHFDGGLDLSVDCVAGFGVADERLQFGCSEWDLWASGIRILAALQGNWAAG
jgi:hypothetical protein